MNDMTPSGNNAKQARSRAASAKRVETSASRKQGNYVDDLKLPGMLHGDFVVAACTARVKSDQRQGSAEGAGVLASSPPRH